MANRVRVAASRKRGGAKRPVKKIKRRRRPGIIALALLGALILGFLARRMMLPSAVHYLAHRPPDSPAKTGDAAQSDSSANQAGGDDSEHLTTGDRDELNSIIKQKAK